MTKILIQSDFDGTITREDQSFLILDEFADGDWRQYLEEYRAGRISVGEFNTLVFAMVRADEAALLNFLRGKVRLRPGLGELVSYCREQGYEYVIVSNGLDFYIRAILSDAGLDGVAFHAATTRFQPGGLDVQYIGPGGKILAKGFKNEYLASFRAAGNRVVYLGDGLSDIFPARLAVHTFACRELLPLCQKEGLPCTPFEDLLEVRRGLEALKDTVLRPEDGASGGDR